MSGLRCLGRGDGRFEVRAGEGPADRPLDLSREGESRLGFILLKVERERSADRDADAADPAPCARQVLPARVSTLIFGEQVSLVRLAGFGVIILGVFVLARS